MRTQARRVVVVGALLGALPLLTPLAEDMMAMSGDVGQCSLRES